MKKTILVITILLMSAICYAEKVYVFIEKQELKDVSAGQTTKGDVVAMCPYTEQYKPTKAELGKYEIVIVDLTEEQREMLRKPMTEEKEVTIDGELVKEEVAVLARKHKIDFEKLSLTKQEQEVEKTIFVEKIIDKSSISIDNK